MSRINKLEAKVRSLYDKKLESRDPWADWLYENHIFLVASKAKAIAEENSIDPDLSQAAAMLHDIADSVMLRSSKTHEAESRRLATMLLNESGYNSDEISIIVDDALRFHSCHGQERPKTDVGKVLATADAFVHLCSDFYLYAFAAMAEEGQSFLKTKKWVLKKIDRDVHNKLFFEEEKRALGPFYDTLKTMLNNQTVPGPVKAKLFTDGGSRGNPGPSAAAFVICKMDDTVVEKTGKYIGDTTNNQAEYQALIMGLERCAQLIIKKIAVYMDSELVVKQLKGIYKIKKPELVPHFNRINELAKSFDEIDFVHIPRALNSLADKEVNRILDEQKVL